MRLAALSFAVGLAIWALPSPAEACESIWNQESPVLPGETAEQHEERERDLARDLRAAYSYNLQGRTFDEAPVVYLASVDSSRVVGNRDGTKEVKLRPVFAIKGQIPSGAKELSDSALTSCGFVGDGGAPQGVVGELVFVFEGLKPNKYWRPNGIDSVRAVDARHESLTWKLYEYFGLKNPNQ